MTTPSIWLIRPKPFDDELLSSWIVRIAWHNVEKLESLCSKLWGTRSQVWSSDIDRTATPEIYKLIAYKCGVPESRAWQTTLASFEGILYETHCILGAAHWLMPLGGRKRHRFLYGLQCCPKCLKEDKEPYYRKNWRLAFITTCSRHRTLLVDRCDCCGSPISFHESDFGSFNFPDKLQMTICRRCGRDYRDIRTASTYQCPWGEYVDYFQRIAESGMNENWVRLETGNMIHSVLFFSGVRHLVRTISTNSHCKLIRKEIYSRHHLLYRPTRFTNGTLCERLDLNWRFEYCGVIGWMLQSWPDNFIDCAKAVKLSSSYFRCPKNQLPYWVEMPITWELNRSWYAPNLDEISAVKTYLSKNGLDTNKNIVSRWLGRWYVTKHQKETVLSLNAKYPISTIDGTPKNSK